MTPTPYPTPTPLGSAGATATPMLDIGQYNDVHNWVVQGYQMANSQGLLDVFWMFIILAIIIMAAWGIMRRMNRA